MRVLDTVDALDILLRFLKRIATVADVKIIRMVGSCSLSLLMLYDVRYESEKENKGKLKLKPL